MLNIRTKIEIWELMAAVLCCVGLFIVNGNLWPMKYPADLASTLITFSTVLLLQFIRLEKIGPVEGISQMCIDIVGYYLGNQIIMALIWEPCCVALGILEDRMTLHLIMNSETSESSMVFLKNTTFVIKMAVALLITYKSTRLIRFIEYAQIWESPTEAPKIRKRRQSRARTPARPRANRRGR